MATATELSKFSLLEVNRILKEGIQGIFPGGIWVVAEISDLNINQSGHCYIELIEKAEGSEKIIAKAKATIWSFTFRILKPYFESVTGQRFSSGIKVLVHVMVEFHELYGMSFNIKDIDPSYTIGDLARRKQEIINRLTEEGVFDLNKELELPVICQRIAVISSETAAGYGDFTKQLKNNARKFKFTITLFQAYMQGDETEKSVISALERIYQNYQNFDVVVIIRGGGSQSELNYFNNYNIAFHITQFPLPVFTGIGHERDQTITDLVANTSLKTPTAVAEYILSIMEESAQYIEQLEQQVMSLSADLVSEYKNQLESLRNSVKNLNKWQLNSVKNKFAMLESIFTQKARTLLPQRKSTLNQLKHQFESRLKYNLMMHRVQLNKLQLAIPASSKTFLKKEKSKLQTAHTLLSAFNPVNILKRGFSITYLNGKALHSSTEVTPGNVIETRLAEGSINSTVNN